MVGVESQKSAPMTGEKSACRTHWASLGGNYVLRIGS